MHTPYFSAISIEFSLFLSMLYVMAQTSLMRGTRTRPSSRHTSVVFSSAGPRKSWQSSCTLTKHEKLECQPARMLTTQLSSGFYGQSLKQAPAASYTHTSCWSLPNSPLARMLRPI